MPGIDIPGMVVTLIGNANSLVAAYAQGGTAAEEFAATVTASSAQVAASSEAMDAAVASSSGALAVASEAAATAIEFQLTMEDALAISAATAAESQLTLDGALAATTGAATASVGSFTAMGAAALVAADGEVVATGATVGLGASMTALLLNPVVMLMAGLAAVAGAAMSLTSTYGDLQKSEALLAATTTAHGISEADVNAQLQANAGVYAQYGQTVEAVRGTITRLIDANLTEQQAFDALPAIMDLAAAKGMSLGEATQAYTKSIAGGGRAMIDLGIQLSKVKGDMTDYGTSMLSPAQMTERLNTLNGALVGQLGDARNSATSMTQASAELSNAWDRLANTVGPPLMAIVTGIVNVIDLAVIGFTTLVNVVMTVVGAVERVVSVLTHLDGSADTATAAVDSLGSASVATAGAADTLTTATAGVTNAANTAAAATYGANGALTQLKVGYDSLGAAIQMTTQQFQDYNVAAAAAGGNLTVAQFQAAGSPDQYLSQGGSYGVTSAPYGYNTATGQPNPAPAPHAAGGQVEAGIPIEVGEKGPEIYVPGAAGTIIPNGGGGAGARSQVSLVVNNPKPEPASTSIARELQKLAAMGFLEPASAGAR